MGQYMFLVNERETAKLSLSWPKNKLLAPILTYLHALIYIPVYASRSIRFRIRDARYGLAQPRFCAVLARFSVSYFFLNPYTLCKLFFRQYQGADKASLQMLYGETPLSTFAKIAEAAAIAPGEKVYELGCGRGLGVFWLHCFTGCECIGVDINPVFIHKAAKIADASQMTKVEFVTANFVHCDFSDADVLYLYGSALADAAVVELVDNLQNLRSGTRVISVSYALQDIVDDAPFKLEQCITGQFVWGATSIYIQTKI